MSSAPQTSVDDPQYGLAGSPADEYAARNNATSTYLNEETSAGIGFGLAVKLGTGDRLAKLPSSKSDKFVGVATLALGFNRVTELDTDGVQPGIHFGVTEKGCLWVEPADDVVPGDEVHVCVTAHSSRTPGQFHKTDDGVYSKNISKYAQWRTSGGTTSGQPAKLAFDFTMDALGLTDS